MKKTPSIINSSRGGLIDEAALIAALDAGEIFGAGLDVFESETAVTPVRTALVNHPKIVTAHTAWLSVEARETLQLRAIEQAVACVKGETPYGLINRELAKKIPPLKAGYRVSIKFEAVFCSGLQTQDLAATVYSASCRPQRQRQAAGNRGKQRNLNLARQSPSGMAGNSAHQITRSSGGSIEARYKHARSAAG